MQFLRLIFVKKLQLQGASPLDPHWGPSVAPTFQLTFPFLIPMPEGLDSSTCDSCHASGCLKGLYMDGLLSPGLEMLLVDRSVLSQSLN